MEREEDKSMPGMLRRGLSADAGVVVGDECPRPEVLAAYFDRSLAADETARYDLHFSRCAKCRQQLAAMARAGSRTDGEEKVASRWGWLIGTRRLAPAGVAFAVLVLVAGFMLHMRRRDLANEVAMSREPGAPPEIVDNAVTNSATRPVEPSPAPNEQTATPAPPLGEAVRENQPSSSGSAKMKTSEEMYRQALAMASRKKQIEAERASNAKGNAGARAVPSDSMVVESDETQQPAAKARKSRSGTNTEVSRAPAVPTASASAAAPGASAPTPNAPAPAPRAAMQLSMKARADDQAAQMARLKMQQAETSSSLAGIEIATPDPKVLWIVSDSGNISRSDDAGATWKNEQIATNDHFVASSAPTVKICWLVGERGTILRTTDGTTWTSVQPPSEADSLGFSRVDAKDDLKAIVTTVDGRNFSTADGGATWKPVK